MLRFLLSLAAVTSLVSTATAQVQRAPKGYTWGFDGCLHRTPAAVLQGLPQHPCGKKNAQEPSAGPAPVFEIATPGQVIAKLDCDFAAAAKATKGQLMDLSKAVISGSLKFSLVTKDSSGASLAIAAIPVFTGASAAPSLEASRLSETTQSNEYTIRIDPAAVAVCPNPSTNRWLTSRVFVDEGTKGGVRIDKFETKVSFVLTKQKGAGLKLNIVPISIGPQFSSNSVNTQSLELTFDFTKKATSTTSEMPPVTPGPPAVTR